MAFTLEEKEQILGKVPTETQDRARAGDADARAVVKQAIKEWETGRSAGLQAEQGAQVNRAKTLEAVESGNYNWDIVKTQIPVDKLKDAVIKFANQEGYALSQSATGGRIINIGKKSLTGTTAESAFDRFVNFTTSIGEMPFRAFLNDPSGMDTDDFFKHVLKQPKDDWMRQGVEKLIKHHLQEAQDLSKEAVEKFGERADISGAGRAEAVSPPIDLTQSDPKDWFPQSIRRNEEGVVVGKNKEILGYKKLLESHDIFTAQQLEIAADKGEFLLRLKEEDQGMLDRLQQLYAQGGNHLSDPEIYDWFVRRGMEKPIDMDFGDAVGAGVDLLKDIGAGMFGSKQGKGMIQEAWEASLGVVFPPLAVAQGGAQQKQVIDLAKGGFRAIGSDYNLLGEGAEGYFRDVVGNLTKEDTPEGEEAFRKAKVERQRQFKLRGLQNQALYSSIAQDIGTKWWKDPQQVNRMVIANSVAFAPDNLIPFGAPISGAVRKVGQKVAQTAVTIPHAGALKTAKLAADDAAKAVSDAQGVLVSAAKSGNSAAIKGAKSKLDDAVKASDDATQTLAELQTKMANQYQELMEAGAEKISGKALATVGAVTEKMITKLDETLDSLAAKISPGLEEPTRRVIEHATLGTGAAAVGLVTSGVVPGVVAGILMGTPTARALARDMRIVGNHIALGARLQPMHRALRASTEVGENVTPQVSRGAAAALSAAELAFPLVDPVARYAGRVGSQVMSPEILDAMAIQGAIGYIGSGGTWQGAVTGMTMGGGMMMANAAGLGFAPTSEAQLTKLAATNARQFRSMLEGTPTGDAYKKLSFDDQKAIAWAMGGLPATAIRIFNNPKQGAGKYIPSTNEIVINTGSAEWRSVFAKHVMKHEHTHYLANHVGVREKVLKELLADTNNRRGGIFAKLGADGKASFRLEGDTIRKIMQGNIQGKTPEAIAQETGLSVEAVKSRGKQLTAADRRRDDVYIETNDEFQALTAKYLDILKKTDPIAALDLLKEPRRYLQEYMAEEVFAEQGAAQFSSYTAEYMKSFRRAAWATDLEGVLGSSRLSGRPASILGRLGAAFKGNGSIQSAIWGKMDAIPEFKRIFDGYNHSLSMNRPLELEEAQAGRGSSFDPASLGNAPGQTPSVEALKEWLANGLIDVDPLTGVPEGISVQADGSWRVTDASKVRRSAAKAEKAAKELGQTVDTWLKDNSPTPQSAQDIKDALDTGVNAATPEEISALSKVKDKVDTGSRMEVDKEIRTQKAKAQKMATSDFLDEVAAKVDEVMVDDDVVAPRMTIDGKVIVAGRYLPEGLLDFLEQAGRFNPHQLANLRDLNTYLKEARHATPITVMYQPAQRAGKARALVASERTVYTTGFEVTQQGNFIYRVWNLDKVMKNGAKAMNSKVGKQLYDGDIGQFNQDVFTFFNNHANGLPGATGLSVPKRDFIRKAIGLTDPKTGAGSGRVPNPYSWQVSTIKDAKDTALNSYRLDRSNWIDLGNPRQRKSLDQPLTSREDPIAPGSYQRIRENYFPGVEAQKRTEVLGEILDDQPSGKGLNEISVKIHDDPDESFIEHEFTHPDVSGNVSLIVDKDGSITASSFIELKDDSINIDGYEYDSINEARGDIEDLFEQAILESERDAFGGIRENKLIISPLFNHFAIPNGFDSTKWEQAGTGSWYMDLYHEETGEKIKISIRDHRRTSRFSDSPDLVEYVSKEWDPREVKEALDRLEKRINDGERIRENYFPGVDDARYMELAKDPEANREELQGLVDAAAESKGFKVVYHGTTKKGFSDIWSSGRLKPDAEPAVYVTTDSQGAGYGDGTVIRLGIQEGRIEIDDEFPGGREDYRAEVGYDGSIQIKSAEPVTYDDSGNVIPISERFNPKKDDIRYFPGVDDARYMELAKDPEANREELRMITDAYRLQPRKVFYAGDIEIIRNPTGEDYRQLRAEYKEAYPHAGSQDPVTRFTTDENGNRWIWRADHGMHQHVEPKIEKEEGRAVSQGKENETRAYVAVLKDREGNIIPLSDRFLQKRDGIRYFPGLDGPADNLAANILDDPDKNGIVKDIDGAAELLREAFLNQYGKVLTAKEMGEKEIRWLADQFVSDALREAREVGNATDWYTKAVEKMLDLAATRFPEIEAKEFDYHAFLAAVAITSQNMKVQDNMEAGVYQYQYRKDNGTFDYSKKHGEKNEAITENLKLFDALIDEFGESEYIRFSQSDFSVRDLSTMISGILKKKVTIAGYQDDIVKGSAAFGPKIGQGFLQNLLGNYDPVTVDLWLRRTFGRLTGDSVRPDLTQQDIGRLIFAFRKRNERGKEKLDSSIELPAFLKGLRLTGGLNKKGASQHKISKTDLDRLFNESTPEGQANAKEVRALAKVMAKEWEVYYKGVERQLDARKNRAVSPKSKARVAAAKAKADAERKARKPQWAFIANTINKRTKPVDSPSALERVIITKAFEIARETLKQEHGLDYSNADLQALLWYPEKDIWGHLKGDSADQLKADYATAMENIINE